MDLPKKDDRLVNENQSIQFSTPLFLCIPVSRLILLSIASFRIYEVYWIYKNWRYIKEREGLKIRPFWRGVFGIFFCQSLLRRIYEDKEARAVQVPAFSPRQLGTGWIALVVFANFLSGYSAASGAAAISISALIPTYLCFVPVQRYINSVEEKRSPALRHYGWSFGQVIVVVMGMTIWALLLIALGSEIMGRVN